MVSDLAYSAGACVEQLHLLFFILQNKIVHKETQSPMRKQIENLALRVLGKINIQALMLVCFLCYTQCIYYVHQSSQMLQTRYLLVLK